ncbi:MAG TPA: 4'-phosphopantetheinyl transferase superfamily protein [Bacteroidia bacterium]|nr:4'-phosphopantetheinyl transferase superfamily protein [Bacteroidia bacterium]
MPIHLTKKKPDGSQIALWQMTESVDELLSLSDASEIVRAEVENFRSETRKKEWLTVRILLKDVLNVAHPDEIVYDEKGKPHLKNGNGHISFSHTKNFAAIIFHPSRATGIDIETISKRIVKISQKFINDKEDEYIPYKKRIEALHIIWGVKEVLFKIYGKGGVDFKKHLHVYPFALSNEGTVDAEIKIENTVLHFRINYFFRDGLVVVYGSQ